MSARFIYASERNCPEAFKYEAFDQKRLYAFIGTDKQVVEGEKFSARASRCNTLSF